MIKRFYKSCISLQFSVTLILNAVLVFILAFLTFKTKNNFFYYAGVVCGILLIAQIAYSEFRKWQVGNQLRGVKETGRYYEEGSMIGRSFILPDRLLACDEKLHIQEVSLRSIQKMEVKPSSKGKESVVLTVNNTSVPLYSDNTLQSRRLAAFLKSVNPSMVIEGTIPDGDGSFASLSK